MHVAWFYFQNQANNAPYLLIAHTHYITHLGARSGALSLTEVTGSFIEFIFAKGVNRNRDLSPHILKERGLEGVYF